MSHPPGPEDTTNTAPDQPNMKGPDLTIIVAATNKMGIGRNGTLPWTGLKKEMAYFARVTRRSEGGRNAVIMGRKTWESIPPQFRPLKGRNNIVVSRSDRELDGGHLRVRSIEGALDVAGMTKFQTKVFVIGGAVIYRSALEREETKRILLTRVLDPFDCDTFFPIELREDGTAEGGWARKSKEELDSWVGETVPECVQVENETRYVFEMWERGG